MTVAAAEGGDRTTTDDMTTGAAGSHQPHVLLAHADRSPQCASILKRRDHELQPTSQGPVR